MKMAKYKERVISDRLGYIVVSMATIIHHIVDQDTYDNKHEVMNHKGTIKDKCCCCWIDCPSVSEPWITDLNLVFIYAQTCPHE